ncbi:MAG TPA: hypothetical protein ENN25_00435 [Euryarchaeota archaeon]|nr:hypothetical protein [Euryarchaeota archaeon]
MEWEAFVSILLMVFALMMVIAGVFTAYFGSGRSRLIGIVLLLIGLVIGVMWTVLAGFTDIIEIELGDVIWDAFLNILAGLIGILAAIGVFLLAIMKA